MCLDAASILVRLMTKTPMMHTEVRLGIWNDVAARANALCEMVLMVACGVQSCQPHQPVCVCPIQLGQKCKMIYLEWGTWEWGHAEEGSWSWHMCVRVWLTVVWRKCKELRGILSTAFNISSIVTPPSPLSHKNWTIKFALVPINNRLTLIDADQRLFGMIGWCVLGIC